MYSEFLKANIRLDRKKIQLYQELFIFNKMILNKIKLHGLYNMKKRYKKNVSLLDVVSELRACVKIKIY